MIHALFAFSAIAFAPPMASRVGHTAVAVAPRAPAPVAIGGFELPKFGGGNKNFQLFPSDLQFKDKDGDTVTLRPVKAGRVDFFVNGDLKLSEASLQKSGDGAMIEITGTVSTDFPFLGLLGFKLEDVVTEGTVPTDSEDVDKAMALVA